MARVIAVCNAKGGVGKTTTAVNLGAYLALQGRRVLLVDFDPQGNASSHLGVSPIHISESIYHGILNLIPPKELVKPTLVYNFHLIPSAPHLAGALVELVGAEDREYFLRKFLNQLRHEYDYILIDLSPSLTLLTVNALAASDEIIIPVQAEYYSLEGLGQLLQTIDMIKENLGHPLKIKGALLTMFDKREHLSREVAKNLRRYFPHSVFDVEIPRSVALAEAPSFGKPIPLYRPDSTGGQAYEKLAREILRLENAHYTADRSMASQNFGNFHIEI
jgi:chromosome partitioning protein